MSGPPWWPLIEHLLMHGIMTEADRIHERQQRERKELAEQKR